MNWPGAYIWCKKLVLFSMLKTEYINTKVFRHFANFNFLVISDLNVNHVIHIGQNSKMKK